MKLIVGLGNPGKKYQNTRHNIGFMVLDNLIGNEKWKVSKNTKALYYKKEINDKQVELFKPQTFMNNSGQAVAFAFNKHNLEIEDLIVVHDDKDLPLGEIKIQAGAGHAGHNGVKSIMEHLKTKEFTRVRIGIAKTDPQKMGDTSKFVLHHFGLLEKSKVKQAIAEAAEKIKELI